MEGDSLKYHQSGTIKAACAAFDLDAEKAQLLKHMSNLIYECGDKILRLTHSKHTEKAEIEAELRYMRFLEEKGVSVAKVVLTADNQLTAVLKKEDHYFTVVCFEKIEGYKINTPKWKEAHFQELGKLTASLHKWGQLFLPQSTNDFLHWNQIDKGNFRQYLPKDERNLPDLHDMLVNEFNTYPKTKHNYGLIHYDIHYGNYLMTHEADKLVLFDFEMLCQSWFINDIATVLYYACFLKGDQEELAYQNNFMHHFWMGYEAIFPIERKEKEKIPKFLLYRDLLVYGFLNKIWKGKDLIESEKNYLERLIKSISFRRNLLDYGTPKK